MLNDTFDSNGNTFNLEIVTDTVHIFEVEKTHDYGSKLTRSVCSQRIKLTTDKRSDIRAMHVLDYEPSKHQQLVKPYKYNHGIFAINTTTTIPFISVANVHFFMS